MMKNVNILVVDDDWGQLRTLGGILEDESYCVALAENGGRAIDLVRERHFDIIFLDIKMPGMDGVQTLKQIKEIDPTSAIVMMTAYSVEEMVKEALREGAYTVVYKPFEPTQVLNVIKDILSKELILIVDDKEADLITMKAVLEEGGFRTITANDGREAVSLVSKGRFDVIFLDIKMPGMDGVQTLKRIKEIDPKIPVVMMTGYSVEHLVRESLRCGAKMCIYKPFEATEIFKAIKKVSDKD
jgi:DNA-binding NtrC family response regulator